MKLNTFLVKKFAPGYGLLVAICKDLEKWKKANIYHLFLGFVTTDLESVIMHVQIIILSLCLLVGQRM